LACAPRCPCFADDADDWPLVPVVPEVSDELRLAELLPDLFSAWFTMLSMSSRYRRAAAEDAADDASRCGARRRVGLRDADDRKRDQPRRRHRHRPCPGSLYH
jgi:hypothetical protein